MSFNTFGKIFRFTTWGESHGPAIGCVVDGCPPNIPINADDIQIELNRRKPGQSKFTTQRKEDDKVQILSGIFEYKTPISKVPNGLLLLSNICKLEFRILSNGSLAFMSFIFKSPF